MTSFGIEWDTPAMIYFGDQIKLFPVEVPILTQKKWAITLEAMDWKKRNPQVTDCMFTVEAQLGIFRSRKKNKFNVSEFLETCKDFTNFWEQIIKTKHIQLGKKYYPVVAYVYNKTSSISDNPFIDCGMTIPGYFKHKANMLSYYADTLEYVKGKPQITIGIGLEYVIPVFSHIIKYFELCEVNDTTGLPCRSLESVKWVFVMMRSAYANTAKQLSILGINSFDEIGKDVVSLILLTNYQFIIFFQKVMREIRSKKIVKSYYGIKLRSNSRIIYDKLLSTKQQKFYLYWATNLAFTDGMKGFQDPNELVTNWFYNFFYNTPIAYSIKSKQNKINIQVPKIGLYSISKEQIQKLQKYVYILPVKYSKPIWSNHIPPHIVFENNTIKYRDYQEVLEWDYMEWGLDQSNIVLELRNIFLLYTLVYRVKTNNYKKNIGLANSVKSKVLCKYIKLFMELILTPALNIPIEFPQTQINNDVSVEKMYLRDSLSDSEILQFHQYMKSLGV